MSVAIPLYDETFAANSIPHGAGVLTLPEAMEYVAGGVYNVKAWGAVGDGVTDDTAAIQATLDACIGGGVVYLPSGTYKFSNITIGNAGTQLAGAGITSTALRTTHVYADGITDPLVWIKASSCSVSNLTVGYITQPDYNPAGSAPGTPGGFLAYINCNSVHENHPIAIGYLTYNEGYRLSNCSVINCYIDSSLCHGITYGLTDNVVIRDNIINRVLATGIVGYMCRQSIVTGNKVIHPRDGAIAIAGISSVVGRDIIGPGEYAENNSISDNIIVDAEQHGIWISQGIGTSITGNVFDGTYAVPINIAGPGGAASRVRLSRTTTIANNIIRRAFGTYSALGYASSGYIHDAPWPSGNNPVIKVAQPNEASGGDVTVIGNLCEIDAPGSQASGIWIVSGQGVAITGNRVLGYPYGAEIISNLGAATWVIGTGWAMPDGTLVKDNDGTGVAELAVPVAAVVAQKYRVRIAFSAFSVGTVILSVGGFVTTLSPNASAQPDVSGDTIYENIFTATSTDSIVLTPSNTSRFVVSALSVLPINGANQSGYGIVAGLTTSTVVRDVSRFVVTGNHVGYCNVGIAAAYSQSGLIASNVVENATFGMYVASADQVAVLNNLTRSVPTEIYMPSATNITLMTQRAGRTGIGVIAAAAKLDVDQTDSAGAIPVLRLVQQDVDQPLLKIIGTSATSQAYTLVDAADFETPGALAGWIKVSIQDDAVSGAITDGTYYIPFYASPTHTP